MGGVGHSRPIIETMLVCRVIGNVHTVASVYLLISFVLEVDVTVGLHVHEKRTKTETVQQRSAIIAARTKGQKINSRNALVSVMLQIPFWISA